MEFMDGRIFLDLNLPELSPDERQAAYDQMVSVLAKLHSYSPKAIGLGDYAKVDKNYYERQIKTWSTQYRATETEKIKSMDYLIDWLPMNIPTGKPQYQKTTIVHGDFRLDNVVFHKTEMKIIAVLDWELSTLGNPFSDLSSFGLIYHLPPTGFLPGLGHFDKGMSGIPTEMKVRDAYLDRMEGLG
jgi:aminoglycoside phosphotransferase (APT) family kinase protein